MIKLIKLVIFSKSYSHDGEYLCSIYYFSLHCSFGLSLLLTIASAPSNDAMSINRDDSQYFSVVVPT